MLAPPLRRLSAIWALPVLLCADPAQAQGSSGDAEATEPAPGPEADQAGADDSTAEVDQGDSSAGAAEGAGDAASGDPIAAEGPESEPAGIDAVDEPIDVTVTASKPARAPGSAYVLSRRTLERYEHDDPHSVLQLVPGVYVRAEDGVGLRPNIGIRGALSDRSKKIALMEDGVPFAPAPYSAPAAYYFPLITRMQQVRVIKGPAALVYGPQTVGGAIDLVTRPIPYDASGVVDLAIGQYGYGKLHGYYGASDEHNGYLIEGVHLRDDGFKQLPDGADTGFFRNEWMFKGSHAFDPSSHVEHEVGLKLSYSEEASNETYLGLTDADFRRTPRLRYAASALDRMEWHRTAAVVTHRIRPLERLSITSHAYRQDFSRVWRKVNRFRGANLFDVLSNPTTPENAVFYDVLSGRADGSTPEEALLVGPNDRKFTSQGVMTKVELEAESGPLAHRLEYSLRFHNDRIERRHSEDAFDVVDGELVPEGSPTVVTAFNEANTDAVSFYALDAVTFRDLTLTPGVRFELIRSTFRDKLSGEAQGASIVVPLPGVGAYYGLSEWLGVLAGVYRGMSPPPPAAEPQIEPEISVNYEAGARVAGEGIKADVIGFYNDYSNLTDICTFSSGCVNENLDRQFDAGKARILGAEVFVEHDLKLGAVRLPLHGAYTFTRAEFRESFRSADPIFGDVEAGDRMPYVPEHQGRASVGVEVAGAGGYVAANYVAPMRETAGSEPLDEALRTDAEFTVDVGARYELWSWLALYGNLRNVFDEQAIVSRRPFGARPNAPRWFQLGLKLEL
jgi:Fe(3+) dicitrate transport protein